MNKPCLCVTIYIYIYIYVYYVYTLYTRFNRFKSHAPDITDIDVTRSSKNFNIFQIENQIV